MHKASTCSPIWERSSESQWLKNLLTCARSGSVTASLAQSSCTIVTAGLVNSPTGLVPGCPCHTNMHFLLDKCWRILLAQLLNFYGPLLGDMNWSTVTKNLFKKDGWHYCLSHSIFIVAQSQTSVLCINNKSLGFNPFPGPKFTCLEPPLALPLSESQPGSFHSLIFPNRTREFPSRFWTDLLPQMHTFSSLPVKNLPTVEKCLLRY